MKKGMLIAFLLPLLIIALVGISQAWQGRMGGMGDPYGLMPDESDFLIHPAKIAKGEGVRFYGYYRFIYTDVTDWDVDLNAVGYSLDMSGYEMEHGVLIGAAFPVGPGRMGLFFFYEGQRGDFDGDTESLFVLEPTTSLDAFDLRLLYGLPAGVFRIGGEVGFAYCQEEHRFFYYLTDLSAGFVNIPYEEFFLSAPPFVSFDSTYWEIPFKAGVEGLIGPVDLELSLRGGVIVSGDNTLPLEWQSPVGVVTGALDMDDGMQGWRVGGDLWMRYSVANGISLPFLIRVDYREKTRDGDTSPDPDVLYDYETNETSLHLVVGGGLDKALAEGTRIAAGLYYGYLHDIAAMSLLLFEAGELLEGYDYTDYPALTEHRIMLNLAGEHEFTPAVALRMGLNCFYGWARGDSVFFIYSDNINIEHSLSGSHWGIGASLGGTVSLDSFTLEPFVNAGYQSLDLSGDGELFEDGVLRGLYGRDDIRSEWYIGGGLAILFAVP